MREARPGDKLGVASAVGARRGPRGSDLLDVACEPMKLEPEASPTAPRKDYVPGDTIGRKYRLLRLLGEGGMGSVWVAENLALKANVALKLIRADVAEDSAGERFVSEARLAARLQHAAIVRVFDFGKTEAGEPFIVMELLEGETLGHRLSRVGSIEAAELFQTLLPIVDGLHAAHEQGVIHRDLKPDNVFIAKTNGGGVQPKLLDFGIAKLRGESAFQSTKLTQAGTLIGSPDYMSPEQARGETDLDPRSDVWALCVLAYECLVGKPPFHGDNYNALLWAIIHDEPVPSTVYQAGDADLWRLLKKGFAKDRSERWRNARELGEALATWLENQGVVEDVCHRSLHASWLPSERPTRPELAAFDESAPSPSKPRAISHSEPVPPATLPVLRKPHSTSLWVAGCGLLSLVVAVLLSGTSAEEEASTAADGAEEVVEERSESLPESVAKAPSEAPEPPASVSTPEPPIGIAPKPEVRQVARRGLARAEAQPTTLRWGELPQLEVETPPVKTIRPKKASSSRGQRPSVRRRVRPKKPATPQPDDFDFGI